MEKITRFEIITLIMFAIVIGIYTLTPFTSDYYEKLTNHTYDAVSLFAVILVFMTANALSSKSLEGKAWRALAVGMIAWLIADLIWTINVYRGVDVFPSTADAFYVLGYLGVFAALGFEFYIIRKTMYTRHKIISAGITLILLGISAYILIPPSLAGDVSLLEKALALFYPIGDAVLVYFASIFILTFGSAKVTRSWLFVGLGMVCWIVADSVLGYMELEEIFTKAYHLLNLFYIAGLFLIAAGAYNHRQVMKGE